MPSTPTQTLAAAGHTALHNDAEAKLAGIAGADLAFSTGDIDIDGTLAANSDAKVPSQKAVRTFAGGSKSVSKTVSTGADGDYTCDGTADEVQIQAALDAVSAGGGGTVFLKEGTYYISNATIIGTDSSKAGLFIDSNCALIGVKGATIITQDAGLKLKYFLTGVGMNPGGADAMRENVHISGLVFDANTSNQSYVDDQNFQGAGIVIQCNNSLIEDIYSEDFGNYGVIVFYGKYNTIRNIRGINGTGYTGNTYASVVFMSAAVSQYNYIENISGKDNYGPVVFIEDYPAYNTVNGIREEHCYGAIMGGGDGTNISNIYSYNSGGNGISMDSCVGIQITNFFIDYSIGPGVVIASNAIPATMKRFSISNGVVRNTGRTYIGCGVYLVGSSYGCISNVNTYDNLGTAVQSSGIYLTSSTGITIQGGHHSHQDHNIRLDNCTDCVVSGVISTLAGGYGILETGTSDYNLFIGNNTRGNTLGTISVVGTSTVLASNI